MLLKILLKDCKYFSGHVSCSLTPSTKQRNFSLVQIQSIRRRKSKCDLKIKNLLKMYRKHCGKRRKCWFPMMFSKTFFHRIVKSWVCVVKFRRPNTTQEELYKCCYFSKGPFEIVFTVFLDLCNGVNYCHCLL